MIAQAHVLAMKRINQIKIPPHKPVTPIHAVHSTLENAAPRIELPSRREAIVLERFRRHAAWLKRDSVITVAIVEPPLFIQQPTLLLQSPVERRARKWCEMVERR